MSAGSTTDKANTINQEKLLSELARLIFKAAPLSVWGTFLGIAFVYLVLQPVVDKSDMLIWALAFSLLNTIRLFHLIFRFKQDKALNSKTWVREFSVLALLSACFWGSASIFLFPDGEPIYQLMLAFVLVTTTAIAITNISMLLHVILPYIVITLLPLVVRFATAEHEAMAISAIMVALSTTLLLGAAYRSNKNIYTTINLQIQEQEILHKLKKSESRLSLHIQQTPLAVIEMDTNMNITQWNNSSEKIFGYSHHEAVGKNISELIVPDHDRENANRGINSLKSQTSGTHGIYENKKKNGEIILCEWFNTALVDENNVAIGYASLAQDITERSRVDKMKNDFVSIVSHELRTPLTSLRGSLSLVLNGMTGNIPDKTIEFLSRADRNAERLTLLINDILDIQAIESGQLRIDLQNTDIVSVINTAQNESLGFAEQSGITIKSTGINQPFYLHIDANRIQQVIDNLISNAIKFSPTNDVITISLQARANDVVISVCDNGPGVSKEFQSSLFDKFTQGEDSSTRNFSGSGLGLSISKGIIEQHGGKIYYKHTASAGSCFSFTLKRLAEKQVSGSEKIDQALPH